MLCDCASVIGMSWQLATIIFVIIFIIIFYHVIIIFIMIIIFIIIFIVTFAPTLKERKKDLMSGQNVIIYYDCVLTLSSQWQCSKYVT